MEEPLGIGRRGKEVLHFRDQARAFVRWLHGGSHA
jgi:hypothetical protein